MFALTIDDITGIALVPINMWYLNDVTIRGSFSNVKVVFIHVIHTLSRLGLDINFSKSDIVNITCDSFGDFELTKRFVRR